MKLTRASSESSQAREQARRQSTSALVTGVSPEPAEVIEVIESLIRRHSRPFHGLPLDREAFGLQAVNVRENRFAAPTARIDQLESKLAKLAFNARQVHLVDRRRRGLQRSSNAGGTLTIRLDAVE
jgi:hypothetical protein